MNDQFHELTEAEMSLVTGATAELPAECSPGTMLGAAAGGALAGAMAGPGAAVMGAALGATGAAIGCAVVIYYFNSKH